MQVCFTLSQTVGKGYFFAQILWHAGVDKRGKTAVFSPACLSAFPLLRLLLSWQHTDPQSDNMNQTIVIGLSIFAVLLFVYIVVDLVRSRSFSRDDGIAMLGIILTVLAIIVSFPALNRPDPTPEPSFGSSSSDSELVPSPLPELTVMIEGPSTAPLNEQTLFTIVSPQASGLIWSVTEFTTQPQAVNPFLDRHEIFIEPTNPEVVGQTFEVRARVTDPNGRSATAIFEFTVVAEE